MSHAARRLGRGEAVAAAVAARLRDEADALEPEEACNAAYALAAAGFVLGTCPRACKKAE